jgi:hypothetical protein
MVTTLVPSYRDVSNPIPIPTFLGKEVVVNAGPGDASRASSCIGVSNGKDLACLQGLGLELSPVKTRSARKKSRTNLSFSTNQLSSNVYQGGLRGMKSLARAKS